MTSHRLPSTLREADVEPVRIRRARLRVTAGPDKGRVYEVPEGGVVVGSDSACEVALSDPSASRRHSEVRRLGLGFQLRDLGSTNGTYVGKHRVESVYLNDGTPFRVGRTSLTFESAESAFQAPAQTQDRFEGMVGASPPMRLVYGAIDRFAKTDLSILIEGDTGTGKELVARAIHARSKRSQGAFVALNCGAFAEGLVEDELFGHDEGAFTGATKPRLGAFEQAHGGTLFLDEIGELPLTLQPKLLRVLETFEVRRLGGTKEKRVDVRIVAATNHDLARDTSAGRFRRDVFFRLSEVRINLPRLADRLEDLPLLVAHFADGSGKSFDEPALAQLRLRPWTGNVRELGNVVRRALAEASGEAVTSEQLPPPYEASPLGALGPTVGVPLDRPIVEARDAVLAEFHRVYLAELLKRHHDDLHAAAKAAGVHVNSLHRLLRNAGLR